MGRKVMLRGKGSWLDVHIVKTPSPLGNLIREVLQSRVQRLGEDICTLVGDPEICRVKRTVAAENQVRCFVTFQSPSASYPSHLSRV